MSESEVISVSKQLLRKQVALYKRSFSEKQLSDFSQETISMLIQSEFFRKARCILAYCSMPDEVDTRWLLKTQDDSKQFLLPVVTGEDLTLKAYTSDEKMICSTYGIWEPEGDRFTAYRDIDLVIVPGVAFDRKLHRLGRGKGFYDRLLPDISAPKAGICFNFQLFNEVPFGEDDYKMDILFTQSEMIMK